MVEDAARKVSEALNQLGCVSVVQVRMKVDQISFHCRIPEEMDAIRLIYQLCLQEDGWQSHFCKKYFLGGDGLKYTWGLSFRSRDISAAADRICRVLNLYREQYLTARADKIFSGTADPPKRPLGAIVEEERG